eukprot:GHVT01065489.1.p1 GENE.GHVT01065489.1~~GHVT01065489.1.p1  ORF type:complete len:312 (-),score=65.84 GHVT01065489.1:699-1589(-)
MTRQEVVRNFVKFPPYPLAPVLLSTSLAGPRKRHGPSWNLIESANSLSSSSASSLSIDDVVLRRFGESGCFLSPARRMSDSSGHRYLSSLAALPPPLFAPTSGSSFAASASPSNSPSSSSFLSATSAGLGCHCSAEGAIPCTAEEVFVSFLFSLRAKEIAASTVLSEPLNIQKWFCPPSNLNEALFDLNTPTGSADSTTFVALRGNHRIHCNVPQKGGRGGQAGRRTGRSAGISSYTWVEKNGTATLQNTQVNPDHSQPTAEQNANQVQQGSTSFAQVLQTNAQSFNHRFFFSIYF